MKHKIEYTITVELEVSDDLLEIFQQEYPDSDFDEDQVIDNIVYYNVVGGSMPNSVLEAAIVSVEDLERT